MNVAVGEVDLLACWLVPPFLSKGGLVSNEKKEEDEEEKEEEKKKKKKKKTLVTTLLSICLSTSRLLCAVCFGF